MIKIIYVLIAVAIIAGLTGIWLAPKAAQAPNTPIVPDNQGTLCTMDAMLCPDGSYVGRTGPQCEFVCPAVSTSSTATTSDYSDVIVVITPVAGSVIGSTTKITGKARGSWYFEASFPIELRDSEGAVLAETHATASGDWMTSEFVPFTATLAFANRAHLTTGVLRFKNDNPSGMPENDKFVDVPVRFAP